MIEVTGPVPVQPPRREVGWLPILVSAVIHSLVMALLLLNPGRPTQMPETAEEAASAPSASIPPYRPPPPRTQQQQQQEPPRQTPLSQDSKNPDAEVPKEAGPEKPPPDPDLLDPSKRLAEAAPPKADPSTETTPPTTTPSEAPKAQMIQGPSPAAAGSALALSSRFGMPVPNPEESRAGTTSQPAAPASMVAPLSAKGVRGFESNDGQAWRPSFAEAAGKCVSIPDLGKDANGRPNLATVQGRVFQNDHVTPLVGAQLQIMGTRFSTFSDANGEYVLRFDPSLLEKCRVQYVQVIAGGFRGELLTLSIGVKVRSDDVVLRRK